jgi:hypothetical protein
MIKVSCLGPLVFIVPKTLNYLAFQTFNCERTWCRLIQKRVLNLISRFSSLIVIQYNIETCGEDNFFEWNEQRFWRKDDLLQVPCRMTQAIISLYFFLSLTLCINSVFCYCNHIFKVSRCLTRRLLLLIFSTDLPCYGDVFHSISPHDMSKESYLSFSDCNTQLSSSICSS